MLSDIKPSIVDSIPRSAMAIGAHPDDAELHAGGTLAKWSRLGCVVTAVVCTDGGAGSADRNLTPSEVAERRTLEQQAAAHDLGVRSLIMLRHADGALEDTPEFRGALVELIREHKPEVVLTHDPHTRHHFLHRDHRIAGRAALDAAYPYARDHLHYPQQIARGLSTHRVDRCLLWDTDEPNTLINISTTIDTKAQALQRHASQLTGIIGDADPAQWLRERSREAACGVDIECAEAFRLLQAPR